MDLHYNRLKVIFSILALFVSCDSQIEDVNDIPSNFYDDSIAAFYNHYEGANHRLSVYLEFLDSTHNVDSIIVNITHSNIDTSLYEFELSNLSEVNSKAFIYEEVLLDSIDQPILSNNIYLYDMLVNIFIDSTNYVFSSDLTTAIAPIILNHDIPETIQLDPNEWKELLINLEIKDLNGADNMESARYEIKKTILEGCEGDCNYDPDCNQDIIDENYISYDEWTFDYVESINDSIHIYQEQIFLRPLDGSALAYDGECPDEDNDQICDGFEATDCGRTGVVEFKLIIHDTDNLSDEIEEIEMEITE